MYLNQPSALVADGFSHQSSWQMKTTQSSSEFPANLTSQHQSLKSAAEQASCLSDGFSSPAAASEVVDLPLSVPLNCDALEARLILWINTFSPLQLADCYWRGARFWLDTGDGELRLTCGDPNERRAHSEMLDAYGVGKWVFVNIGVCTADEHPLDEDGELSEEWEGAAAWMLECLLFSASDIAASLEAACEPSSEYGDD